jgi:hypothetical protein
VIDIARPPAIPHVRMLISKTAGRFAARKADESFTRR